MPATEIPRQLSILVVLAEPGLDVAPILAALRHNTILVCPTPAQAVAVIERFEPDIIFIDFNIVSPLQLKEELMRASAGRNQAYVMMTSTTGPISPSPSFEFSVNLPASTAELDELLANIGRRLRVNGPPAFHTAG